MPLDRAAEVADEYPPLRSVDLEALIERARSQRKRVLTGERVAAGRLARRRRSTAAARSAQPPCPLTVVRPFSRGRGGVEKLRMPWTSKPADFVASRTLTHPADRTERRRKGRFEHLAEYGSFFASSPHFFAVCLLVVMADGRPDRRRERPFESAAAGAIWVLTLVLSRCSRTPNCGRSARFSESSTPSRAHCSQDKVGRGATPSAISSRRSAFTKRSEPARRRKRRTRPQRPRPSIDDRPSPAGGDPVRPMPCFLRRPGPNRSSEGSRRCERLCGQCGRFLLGAGAAR